MFWMVLMKLMVHNQLLEKKRAKPVVGATNQQTCPSQDVSTFILDHIIAMVTTWNQLFTLYISVYSVKF